MIDAEEVNQTPCHSQGASKPPTSRLDAMKESPTWWHHEERDAIIASNLSCDAIKRSQAILATSWQCHSHRSFWWRRLTSFSEPWSHNRTTPGSRGVRYPSQRPTWWHRSRDPETSVGRAKVLIFFFLFTSLYMFLTLIKSLFHKLWCHFVFVKSPYSMVEAFDEDGLTLCYCFSLSLFWNKAQIVVACSSCTRGPWLFPFFFFICLHNTSFPLGQVLPHDPVN